MYIAIVGSHPENWHTAPFKDESWQIWGFSRRNYGKLPRCDLWFELHPKSCYRSYELNCPGYVEWLGDQDKKITGAWFPFQELVDEFGPYFFRHGQVPWIMAYAIRELTDNYPPHQKRVIGLWGVEGALEYQPQRPEIHYFTSVARYRGIEVIAPGTDLLKPGQFYAFS